jgi:hypothetical protein
VGGAFSSFVPPRKMISVDSSSFLPVLSVLSASSGVSDLRKESTAAESSLFWSYPRMNGGGLFTESDLVVSEGIFFLMMRAGIDV